MKSQWILQGKVCSGAQKAAYFTQLDWVQQQCHEKLDFKPFPGTLNIDVGSDYLSILSELQSANLVELIANDKDSCSGRVLPILIENSRAAIIIPQDNVNIHGQNIIEVIAPVDLRDTFALMDGHRVTIYADKPGRTQLQAVIFDLDGTLLDSVGIYYQIVCLTLRKLGHPEVSMDTMRAAVNNIEFDWKKILPPSINVKRPGFMEEIQATIEEFYKPMFESALPIPGMKETVEGLVAAKVKLAIVTSTPRENIDFKLNQLKLNDTLHHFEVILCSNDAARKKPAPDPMIECCKQLSVALNSCVYIGDSIVDIQSGRSAGMKTIAVLSGFDDLDTLCKELPDAVISSIADLKAIINY